MVKGAESEVGIHRIELPLLTPDWLENSDSLLSILAGNIEKTACHLALKDFMPLLHAAKQAESAEEIKRLLHDISDVALSDYSLDLANLVFVGAYNTGLMHGAQAALGVLFPLDNDAAPAADARTWPHSMRNIRVYNPTKAGDGE